MKPKRSKAFRLSVEADRLLWELSNKFQISQTAVLEIAIREVANRVYLFTKRSIL